MKFKTFLLVQFFSLAIFAGIAHAAQDSLTNLAPQAQSQNYEPGTIVLLPGGQRSVIERQLPDGRILTDLGIIISPEGLILEGEGKGETATLLIPEQQGTDIPRQIQPEIEFPKAPSPTVTAEEKKADIPEQPKAGVETKPAEEKPNSPEQKSKEPEKPQHYSSIAELLPMTRMPEEKTEAPSSPEKKKTDNPKAKKQEAAPKAEQHKAETPKEKPGEKPKAEKKPVSKTEKPKPGQELRIPPEAAKSGNLDFLEGCWQGTRPEYYSKRIIRECFCFGANGKNGKRRVYDHQGGRQCIGATRAALSKSGVLSVTSSGAACSDGERWGQAEMVCRNSGPKTPCSWVFRDANNGRQAYEIPFVRVESCGR